MVEANVPPDRSRLVRAWRGGLRARSRWWMVAVQAWVVAVLLSAATGTLAARWLSDWLEAAMQHGAGLPWPPWALWGCLAIVPGMAVTAAVAVAALTRSLGAIDRDELKRVAPRRQGSSLWLGFAVLGVVAGCFAVFAPVIAAGARAVAGSEAVLAQLWQTWAVRIVFGMAAILGVAGLAELGLHRLGIRRSLYRTIAQAQRDAQQGERR